MSRKDSRTIGRSMEETRQYHSNYLMAVSNPVRREILRALRQGPATVEGIHSRTGLDPEILEWHLSILEHGFCVRKEVREGKAVYELTKEGMIVDYLNK